MALFLITYDLDRRRPNHGGLIDALVRSGAQRAQFSTWILRGNCDIVTLRNSLLAHIGSEDRLLVAEVGDCAAWNMMVDLTAV
jgi:hypothetical protein